MGACESVVPGHGHLSAEEPVNVLPQPDLQAADDLRAANNTFTTIGNKAVKLQTIEEKPASEAGSDDSPQEWLASVETIVQRETQELRDWIAVRISSLESKLDGGEPSRTLPVRTFNPLWLTATNATHTPPQMAAATHVAAEDLATASQPLSWTPQPTGTTVAPKSRSRSAATPKQVSIATTSDAHWDAIRWTMQTNQLEKWASGATRSASPNQGSTGTSAARSGRQKAWEARMINYMDHLYDQRSKRKIPPDNCLAKFVLSGRFTAAVTMVILLNAVMIGLETQDQMNRALENADVDKPQVLVILNLVFTSIFTAEILLSMIGLRSCFFIGPGWAWNMFDLILVTISLLEIYLGPDIAVSKGYIRLLRVLRISRALRLIRIVRFFRELRCMCLSIITNFLSFLWAMVLLLLLMYTFAVIFMQAGVQDLESSRERVDEWRLWYPSIGETMYTLAKSVSGGENWVGPAEPLGEVSVLYQMAFLFYILFIVFGALNVITGVFLQKAMESMEHDRDWVTQAESIKLEKFTMDLIDLFHEIDLDGSGQLTWHKFMLAMDNPRTQAFFMSHGLDIADAHLVFNLVVGEDGQVGVGDFVKGCSQAKGAAKSTHMLSLMHELEHMHQELRQWFQESAGSAGLKTAAGGVTETSGVRWTGSPPHHVTSASTPRATSRGDCVNEWGAPQINVNI